MTSILLFGYAAILAVPVAWLLRRATWTSRAPALGVIAWHVLSASVLVAILFGAFAAIPDAGGGHDEHNRLMFIEVCLLAVMFLAVVGAIVGKALVSSIREGSSQRRRHRRLLHLVGRADAGLDAVLVDHASAAAYCVPGRGSRVVLTTAALAVLDDAQLAAVLAHEQAHLRGRHHMVLAAGRILRRAFPWVPAFRWGHDEVTRLVELIADDAAAHRCERHDLAAALLVLAADSRPVVPVTAFAASGSAVAVRVKRLLGSEQGLSRRAVAGWSVAFLLLLAGPLLAVSPALAGAGDLLSHCPFF
ncbi:MAG TPA: M56 family metallopeptidase [Jiangellaceae bacterium]